MGVTWVLMTLLAQSAWPVVELDTLAGAKVRFPAGQPCVLVMSFSREAGEASKRWAERFARDGATVYIAPVLEAAPRLIRGLIRSGLRRDIPAALQARTLLIYKGEAEWKQRVGFVAGTEKQPYIMALDGGGGPRAAHHGAFDEKTYADLRPRFFVKP